MKKTVCGERKLNTKCEASCFLHIRKLYHHPILVLTALMAMTTVLVFFLYLTRQRLFLFWDVGSDTTDVYYPFFVALRRKLVSGDFTLWDFSYGLGTNAVSRQADIGSIFTWFIVLFPERYIKYAILISHILKIFASGYACYLYVNCFKFSRFSKVLVSYLFAFNGFTILWGQHYFFATAALDTVLVLFAIEKALRNKRCYILVSVATFIVAVNSYYFAYMVLAFAAVYALIRIFYIYGIRDIKSAVVCVLSLLGSVALGVAMAGFLFMPSAYFVLNNSKRLQSQTSIFVRVFGEPLYDGQSLLTILSRFFSNNLLGTRDYEGVINYYEAPEYFFSSFIMFFAVVFFIQNIFSKEAKSKILKFISFALVVYLCFFPSLSIVLNGFVTPFFRFTFLVMPIFAILFADTIDKIRNKELRFGVFQIVFSAVVSVSLMLFSMALINHEAKTVLALNVLYIIAIVAVAGICVVMLKIGTETRLHLLCCMFMALVMFCNVTLDSFIANNRRGAVIKENSKYFQYKGNDDVSEALDYLRETDDSFYRVDKTFFDISYLNDSLFQGYYSCSCYNSLIETSISDFGDQYCPEYKINNVGYIFSGICRQSEAVTAMGVRYFMSYDRFDDMAEYELVRKFGEVYLYRNTMCDGIGMYCTEAEVYSDIEQIDLTSVLKRGVVLKINEGYAVAHYASGDVSFERPDSGVVKGKVKSEGDGYLYVAIPSAKGWTAYVDGQKTDIIPANTAFSAINVLAGEHEVVFKYNTPMFKEGVLISAGGFACLAIWFIILLLKRRKENDSL